MGHSVTMCTRGSGRRLYPTWNDYERLDTPSGKGWKAKCKKCHKVIQGIVDRMNKHSSDCSQAIGKTQSLPLPLPILKFRSINQCLPLVPKRKGDKLKLILGLQRSLKMWELLVRWTNMQSTSSEQKKKTIGCKVATNTPFRSVEHPEFKALISSLRPGYNPPTRYEISDALCKKGT